MPKISPKLTAAIAPPLTAVVTAMILTGDVDRTSLAALAAIVIAAALGYHAPSGAAKQPVASPFFSSGTSTGSITGGVQITSDNPATPYFNEATGAFSTGDGNDGDDQLPAELADHPAATSIPHDEIDSPDQTQEG